MWRHVDVVQDTPVKLAIVMKVIGRTGSRGQVSPIRIAAAETGAAQGGQRTDARHYSITSHPGRRRACTPVHPRNARMCFREASSYEGVMQHSTGRPHVKTNTGWGRRR